MQETIAFARLTPGQRHALRTDGFGLINAVAGSGKTTQLVALTLKTLLENPQSGLERLAIITFTRKAGAELRDRLRRAMEDELKQDRGTNPERAKLWQKWLGQLPGAPIGTIDALVQQILRRMSLEAGNTLGLDPAFRVHDETRTAVLIRRALHQVLDKPDAALKGELPLIHKQHTRHGIEVICEQFLIRGGEGHRARAAIEALHGPAFAGARAPDFNLLEPVHLEVWLKEWKKQQGSIAEELRVGLAECGKRDNATIQEIHEALALYEAPHATHFSQCKAIREALFNKEGKPLSQGLGGKKPYSPTLAALQEKLMPVVKLFDRLPNLDWDCPLFDPQPVREWRHAWGLLLEAVDRRFAQLCARESSYPFFLLGRLLLGELRGRGAHHLKDLGLDFLRVMVDEFQDNTQQQWEIACHLARGNPEQPETWGRLTLVGDPEQAIYHWRGSNPRLMELVRDQYLESNPQPMPTWYDSRRGEYGHRESEALEKIGLGQLDQNYRTAETTLDLIDRASQVGMRHQNLAHVHLLPGKPDLSIPRVAEHVEQRSKQAEVRLLLPPDPEERSKGTDEEEEVANDKSRRAERVNADSLRMVAAHLRRMHEVHGIAWKEMMVLAHSFNTLLEPLQDALIAEGIPCRALVRDALWQRQEVADLVNLTRFLADVSDSSAMVGVLLGPIARWIPSELLLVGMLGAGKEGTRPNVEAGLRQLVLLEGIGDLPGDYPASQATVQAWRELPEARREHLAGVARKLIGNDGWRCLVDRMPHHQLTRLALRQSGGWEALAAWHSREGISGEMFDRAGRGLDHALSRMEEIEAEGPLSLREMAETLTGLMEGEIAEKVDAELGPGEDLVRIMTVHVSKGLEARVVALLVPVVGSKGNTQPAPPSMVLLDRQYFKKFDPLKHGRILGIPLFKYPNFPEDGKRAFESEEESQQTLVNLAKVADQVLQLQESVRLFHVAITRAEAGLFIAGSRAQADESKYRLWPQWFCEQAWPLENRDTTVPPPPEMRDIAGPTVLAGPTPVLDRLERPATLTVKRAETFLNEEREHFAGLELAHLGLQPDVRPIPADWVEGNVLRATRDLPGTVVGTLVHRGFEMGEDLPEDAEDRLRFFANMARGLMRERKAEDGQEMAADNGELLADRLAQTTRGILHLMATPEGRPFLDLVRASGAAEVDFSLRQDYWLIRGRIDRLLDDGTIIDWKTDDIPAEKIIEKYRDQMLLYALALWVADERPNRAKQVQLAMTHHQEIHALEFSPTELKAFEARLRQRLTQAAHSLQSNQALTV